MTNEPARFHAPPPWLALRLCPCLLGLLFSGLACQREPTRVEVPGPAQLLSTGGVNLDPHRIDPASHSTAHLEFIVDAEIQGRRTTLVGNRFACINSPTYCSTAAFAPDSARPGRLVAEVTIGRFAQGGRARDAEGKDLEWLVTMEDGRSLKGTLTVPVDEKGRPQYPGELTLSGKMVIEVQPAGLSQPVTLRSRKESLIQGDVAGWPPHGATMTMRNGPTPYYDERELENPDAKPLLVVHSSRVRFTTSCLFLGTHPEINRAIILDPAGLRWRSGPVRGVKVSWQESSDLVEQQDRYRVEFTSYHVYRNRKGDPLSGWSRIASVPRTQDYVIDTGYDGTTAFEYLVMRADRYPFGYMYEGLYGTPTTVDAVIVRP